ncbi:FAD-binding oxidoreductase [Sulfurimonas sp. SAG-AH-194-C20]|nr:FAD-dependent oxidoreductase [Sulfurimonas sp. SAG-AH-194-C20]MDF1879136.1 FAD-binding oxidoreductase [Sulfurimonas sp. SAG-AH-194-C20]
MYDVAIIGAGINGCACAYELTKEGKRVALFDKEGVASGGSGAAGAFISPKFSKSGELKELLHTAFKYSMNYYEKEFPQLLTKSKLLHIAKDEADDEILRVYKAHTDLELFDTPANERESLVINAGLVSAKALCNAMAKSAKNIKEEVSSLEYDNGVWIINESYTAKEVILATGAYKQILAEPYIQLRGIWGHRIDVETTTRNANSIHQEVSISPSKEGQLAIGATHNVHYHPDTSTEVYDVEEGREELLEKASRSIKLENVKVLKDYTGLRSGSFDYLPLIGSLVLSSETLENKNIHFQTKKPNFDEYTYYPSLSIINGSGGYGFVLAPYLAKILTENIFLAKEIPKGLQPARFFARWAKKF